MPSLPPHRSSASTPVQGQLETVNPVAIDLEELIHQQTALEQQLNLYEKEIERLRHIEQTIAQERRQTEITLQYQQAENRAILEALPDMMLRVRQDGFCLDFLPPIGKDRDKYTPIHFHLAEVLPPDLLQQQLQAVQQALTTRTLQVYEHSFEKQGTIAHEEVRISAINEQEVLIIVRDISDRKHTEAERQRAEAALRNSEAALREKAAQLGNTLQELQQTQMQLVQTEKMSSLGQLVAGIAHEINNPVSFIQGNLVYAERYSQDLVGLVSLYQQHTPQPALPIQERLAELELEFLLTDLFKVFQSMETGVDRICQIVQALRTFSHLDQTESKVVDVHVGLDSVLTLLKGRLENCHASPIQVQQNYGELPLVECYVGELNQVLMHILSNAIDALETKAAQTEDLTWQPTITIKTEYLALECSALEQNQTPNAQPTTNFVCIHIIDNGVGISEAVQQQVFDPFFTTKSVGQGMGMGLAISYQIITQKHRGTLTVHSTPDISTKLSIQIPVQV